MATTAGEAGTGQRAAMGAALAGLLAVAVAGVLAGYAKAHNAEGQALFTLGFSGMLPMKAWLTTGAALFAVVQLLTAASMWQHLPGQQGEAPSWVPDVHRWSGVAAFVLTLPVGFHCVWSLGFATGDARTVLHSIAGCLFYGVFAAKMLTLRLRAVPGWLLPLLGGLLVVLIATLWFGAALWYFTRSGAPLT